MSDEYEEIEIYEDEHGNLTDAAGNPVDEDGNRVAEVGPEPVPSTPAAQQPAARKGKAKFLVVGAAALVLLVGGGIAYGLHTVGQQNTAEDVKEAVAAKSSEVREAVSAKSSEVRASVAPEPKEPARNGVRVTGAACLDPAAAQWDGEGDPPDHRLRQEGSARLPSSVSARVKKRDSRNPSEIAITQPEKARLFVYASDPAGIYTRATVSIAAGLPVVLGSGNVVEVGTDDRDACPTNARPTAYAVVDGKKEKAVEIVAAKAVGDTLYGVTGGGDIAELTLEKIEPESEAPTPDEK